jgi:hypothetical protein
VTLIGCDQHDRQRDNKAKRSLTYGVGLTTQWMSGVCSEWVAWKLWKRLVAFSRPPVTSRLVGQASHCIGIIQTLGLGQLSPGWKSASFLEDYMYETRFLPLSALGRVLALSSQGFPCQQQNTERQKQFRNLHLGHCFFWNAHKSTNSSSRKRGERLRFMRDYLLEGGLMAITCSAVKTEALSPALLERLVSVLG